MLRRKKGGEPFFHAQLESIAVPSHGTMVIRTVLTDITEIKRLEDEVRQARKMATIGQFADGMAHDFKNVLSVITCYSDLIRTGMEKDDPSQAYLDQIAASSHEAASFVRSLMAFSRKDHANPEVCNVNDVVGRMGEVLRRLLRENIELRLKLTSEYLMTMIDAVQMDQVLMNLAANATDAMPGGGVLTIETGTMAIDKTFVRAKGYGEPGRYVLLSVSDSGIGMDETTKARVFEPFFTTKDAGSGTGLGLSTVYDIVRHNNGYITVSSKPRQGTMFSICLPLIGAERQHDLPSRK
jgi:signal transduction histidine kinase